MMEYLFRAWSEKLGMSSEFGLGARPGWPKIQKIPRKPGQQLVIHQELNWHMTCKIMQYTGRDDSGGVKIFKGDIVEFKMDVQDNVRVGVIEYKAIDTRYFIAEYQNIAAHQKNETWQTYPIFQGVELKKIGNRFENQELFVATAQ